MEIFKKVVNKLALVGLASLLILGIPLMIATSSLTNKEIVKTWLNDAEVYKAATTEVYKQAQKEALESQDSLKAIENNSFFDEEQIFASIAEVLDAEFLKEQTEKFLDGIYGWLDGTTEAPEYTVSLANKWPETGGAIKQEIIRQYNSLPQCEVGRTQIKDIEDTKCRITGLDIEKQVDDFINRFKEEDNVIATGVWRGQDLLASAENEEGLTQEDLELGQTGYSLVSSLPIVLIVLGLIASVVAVFTSKSWLYGLRGLGITVVVASLLMGLMAAISSSVNSDAVVTSGEGGDDSAAEVLNTIVAPLVETVADDVSGRSLVMAIVGLVVGIALIVGSTMILRRSGGEHQVENDNPDVKNVETAPAAQPKTITPSAKSGDVSKPTKSNLPPRPAPSPAKKAQPKAMDGVAPKKNNKS